VLAALEACRPGSRHERELRAFLRASDALARAVLAVDVALGSGSWRPVPPEVDRSRLLGGAIRPEGYADTVADLELRIAAHTSTSLDGFDAAILDASVNGRGVEALRAAVIALGQVADLVGAVHLTAPFATVAVGIVVLDPDAMRAARAEITGALVFAGNVDRSAHDCFHAGRGRLARSEAVERAKSRV
jgi:hypothetical protein